MSVRIFSQVVYRVWVFTILTTASSFFVSTASAQSGGSYLTDPETGIVYQQIKRTIEKPVVQTTIQNCRQTVYRQQRVTETKPQARTVYTPVIEYKWEPRVHGRWNPFREPTVAYHHVPHARWEQRSDVIQQTTSRTEWVPETRNVEVPKQIVRMQRQEKVELEPVGRVAPTQPSNLSATGSIASRLRPLNSNETITPTGNARFRIASSSVGRTTSDQPSRSSNQSGMRAITLSPSSPTLPTATTGIANSRPLPLFR